MIYFSSNVNDFSPLSHQCSECHESLSLYPDPDQSRYTEGLCRYSGVSAEDVAILPGLTYFIRHIQDILGFRKALVGSPTFMEYRSSQFVNGNVSYITYEALLKNHNLIGGYSPDLVVLVSPSNPTGEVVDHSDLVYLLDYLSRRGISLFLDEAFVEFAGRSLAVSDASLVSSYSNLYIGRSLSKLSGLPSLRSAYVITSPENVSRIFQRIPPWMTSQFFLHLIAQIDFDALQYLPAKVAEVRNRFVSDMQELGFHPVGKPSANYVTFRCPRDHMGEKLVKGLLRSGVLIRSLWNYPEFGQDFIRIAIKRREKMEMLIGEIRRIIGNG